MTFDFAVLAPLVSGPAAAVFVCLVVMWKGYKLIVEQMIPAQRDNIQDILEEHRKDRKVFVDGLVLMDKRLTSVEDDISQIKHIIVKENG
tara:strand:- start:1332 stop:1601 length:270 start_codon:yes stop_codon:yes gene_type:complete